MIDKNLIMAKAGKVDGHLRRIKAKRSVKLKEFLGDLDIQESILFNLQMAVQNCIDIAAHIISDDELGVAGSTSEMFYMLQENGYLTPELTEKMVAAVGFRNLVTHEYGKIDLTKVYQIAHKDVDDLEEYLGAIFRKCGMG
ncbi:MAG: hypothetical protein AMK69_24995 [Nitrospira bacterium SG8_3]|nr:MAG: hypothetical protein AMK69_24995 [Nitrospira bacterium SG8_3]